MTLQTVYPQQAEHFLSMADLDADAERERKLKRELADLRDVVRCLKATILSQQAEVLLAQAQAKQAQEEAAYAMLDAQRERVERQNAQETVNMMRADGRKPATPKMATDVAS